MLFTPEEKLEFLSRIDELSEDVRRQVEVVIDEYDTSYKKATKISRDKLVSDLTALEKKQGNNKSLVSAFQFMKQGAVEMFS